MTSHALLPENIHPLTDFLRNPKVHLQRLKRNQRPSVLTLNGKAQVVVQDAKAYQALLETMEVLETRQAISEGIASMRSSKGEPAAAAFDRLRKKHG